MWYPFTETFRKRHEEKTIRRHCPSSNSRSCQATQWHLLTSLSLPKINVTVSSQWRSKVANASHGDALAVTAVETRDCRRLFETSLKTHNRSPSVTVADAGAGSSPQCWTGLHATIRGVLVAEPRCNCDFKASLQPSGGTGWRRRSAQAGCRGRCPCCFSYSGAALSRDT